MPASDHGSANGDDIFVPTNGITNGNGHTNGHSTKTKTSTYGMFKTKGATTLNRDAVIALVERAGGELVRTYARMSRGQGQLGEFSLGREHAVLELMASDLARAQIAEALFVSENTVKSQQRTLFRKLGATTRVEALLTAQRLGLL